MARSSPALGGLSLPNLGIDMSNGRMLLPERSLGLGNNGGGGVLQLGSSSPPKEMMVMNRRTAGGGEAAAIWGGGSSSPLNTTRRYKHSNNHKNHLTPTSPIGLDMVMPSLPLVQSSPSLHMLVTPTTTTTSLNHSNTADIITESNFPPPPPQPAMLSPSLNANRDYPPPASKPYQPPPLLDTPPIHSELTSWPTTAVVATPPPAPPTTDMMTQALHTHPPPPPAPLSLEITEAVPLSGPVAMLCDGIRSKFGFLFDGAPFHRHLQNKRYPSLGMLCFEEGPSDVHLVWLATDGSAPASDTVCMRDIRGLWPGKTSPSIAGKTFLGDDNTAFFSVSTADAVWDLESAEPHSAGLWLAAISSVSKVKPHPMNAAAAAPKSVSAIPIVSAGKGSASSRDGNGPPALRPPIRGKAGSDGHRSVMGETNTSRSKTPAQSRWDSMRKSQTGTEDPKNDPPPTAVSMEKMLQETLTGLADSLADMARVQGQCLVEAVRAAHEKPPPPPVIKEKINWFNRIMGVIMPIMDSTQMQVITTLATVWAIFGSDVYAASYGPPSGDTGVYGFTLVVFLFFCMDIIINTLGRPQYRNSFFFWLDLISAISLIPDFLLAFNIQALPGGQLAVAQAGRAARAGTRAARLVRIVKLIAMLQRRRAGVDPNKKSKIGDKMSDLISQKVIVIVALMLMMSGFTDLIVSEFDPALNWDISRFDLLVALETSEGAGLGGVDGSSVQTYNYTMWYANEFIQNWQGTLRYLYVAGLQPQPLLVNIGFSDLRSAAIYNVSTPTGTSAVFDYTLTYADNALSEVLQVLFVVILLAISAVLFNRDTQILVIAPLESMSEFVNRIVQNPLMNVTEMNRSHGGTHFVASAIKKFLRLLQIALGDAGASIMSANLGSGRGLTAVIPGRKVRMVFGFCDIRRFTDCTECLQEEVMVFVNTIAKIVHHACKENEGSPNKNIGDAFLLAWNLPDKKARKATEARDANGKGPASSDKEKTPMYLEMAAMMEAEAKRRARMPIADHALKSFVQVINETMHCAALTALTNSPVLQQRIPGYRTSMGFGLHLGWAIEGAIGSEYKIDASYLSPNVNMASRLEAATKQYGVPILMTDAFWMSLTASTRALCRRLDRVTVKGSVQPISLYSFDAVPRDPCECQVHVASPGGGHKHQTARQFFDANPPKHNAVFRNKFNRGVELYVEGKWKQSKVILRQCVVEAGEDTPSKVLLDFMKAHQNKPPPDWEGFRELTEK